MNAEVAARDAYCPICRGATEVVLSQRFGAKMQLPTNIELRHCQRDEFLFVTGGSQSGYDQYYASVANDSYHREVSGGAARSPIARRQAGHIEAALEDFFKVPRNVLDFGCGEASLLIELAADFPSSTFAGFEPGPAARGASATFETLGLNNVSVDSREEYRNRAPYDLVIVSHVLEHILDFDFIHLLRGLLKDGGILYAEVPDSLRYETHERVEFLYYFDRLHVNHFTPRSMARLISRYGFGYLRHFEYAFPYRDGGEYPALGMLFRKGGDPVDIASPHILDGMNRYIERERERAKVLAGLLDNFEGVLVWGAGDNFHRSVENGGPLSRLRNMVLLDRRSHEVVIGDRMYATREPRIAIQEYPWPVAVTVSEHKKEISRQIVEIDPGRRIFFV